LRHDIKLEWVENIIHGHLRENCDIEDVTINAYNWIEVYTVDKFIKLIQTFSSSHKLNHRSRAALHFEVQDVINQHDGSLE